MKLCYDKFYSTVHCKKVLVSEVHSVNNSSLVHSYCLFWILFERLVSPALFCGPSLLNFMAFILQWVSM